MDPEGCPELRITDDDVWAKVQALKSRFTGWVGNKRQTKRHLLRGLVTCPCCWGTMTIARRGRCYCNTRIDKGTCDARHGIVVADLEARVLGGPQRLLVGNEARLQAFADEFRVELERLQGERRKDETKLRRDLGEAEHGTERCLGFILSGDGAPASVRTKVQELEATKARPEAGLASLHAAPPAKVEGHSNLPEFYAGAWRRWPSSWEMRPRGRRRSRPSEALSNGWKSACLRRSLTPARWGWWARWRHC